MKKLSGLLLIALLPLVVSGGDPDTLSYRKWYVPDHIKVQFAGNIGLISAGPGYQYAKNIMELDLMYGYVPESAGGTLHSLTLKNTCSPLGAKEVGKNLHIDFITVGVPLTYTFGKQFFLVAPRDQYPKRYYDYSSALRIGIFAGGRVNYILRNNSTFSKAGIYYEIGTYDLLLHNYIFNKDSMRFGNLFSLAFGASIHLK